LTLSNAWTSRFIKCCRWSTKQSSYASECVWVNVCR